MDDDVTRDGDETRLSNETWLSETPTTRPRSVAHLQEGDEFGTRYRIIKQLGVGGMGVVYQAWDTTLNVVVALKVIRPDTTADPTHTAEIERRFKQELLLARQVTHRNVVRIHDLGDIDGTKYITMSFVEGEDLSTVLKREGTLPIDRVLPLARQIASGLEAAHEAGVVHRDLKPPNIMVDAEDHALIMDFGIAVKGADTAGAVIGTVEYMSPEQSKGEAVDLRTDVYAFGLILTDLLLGRRTLVPGKSAWETLTDRISRAPEPLATRDPNVPADFDAVITKCLQLDPADRYLTTADLVAALQRLDDQGNLIPENRTLPPRLMAGAAVLTLGLVAGTWWYSQGPGVQPTEPVSVLIADFDNQTGDPVFTGLVEQAMAVGVEGASFISAYQRREALRDAATLRADAGLDASVAKLVSMRQGLDVIIGGDVTSQGAGVALRVTATRTESDEVLLDWTTTAPTKDQILEAVGRAAARVRQTLGDTRTDSAASDSETFTAASLDAAKAYAEAQELQWAGRIEDAITAYERAITLDASFGRAHASVAALYVNLGRPTLAETSYLAALSHLDRMTEREKFRTRAGYYLFKKNSDKALEEFQALVAQYPADTSGLATVAVFHFYRRDMANALETGRRASDIYPKNVSRRNDVALFAMYAGNFERAITLANDVLQISPDRAKAYVAMGLSQLALGHSAEAAATWDRLDARTSPGAKAEAASGRIDLALFEGRDTQALAMLDTAIAEDRAAGSLVSAGRRLAIKAEVLLAQGNNAAALTAARDAIAAGRKDGILYMAARIMIGAGEPTPAEAIATDLDSRLDNERGGLRGEPRIYAALLRGEAALAAGRPRDALTQFEAAQALADTWLGRLSLGRAYLALGAFPEAAAEFEGCLARKGEATAVFLDDLPSYRLMRPIEGLLKQARSGLR